MILRIPSFFSKNQNHRRRCKNNSSFEQKSVMSLDKDMYIYLYVTYVGDILIPSKTALPCQITLLLV